MFTVSPKKIKYTDLRNIPPDYTDRMDKEYNWMAKGYDAFMVVFPLWKKWIKHVIPYIQGSDILEVSFGSGYLMTQYANSKYKIQGIDYNEKMIEVTRKKIEKKKIDVQLSKGNVEELPYPDNTFDTIINTMAFTGFHDGDKALVEMKRVLKPGGRLLIVDFDYPQNRNVFGYMLVKLFEKFGDIIRNIELMLKKHKFEVKRLTVGGFGSVQFFIAEKK